MSVNTLVHFLLNKTSFSEKLCVTYRNHATTVVTLFFSLTHVTCTAVNHTLVIKCSTSVTHRTLCHSSDHLGIYHECYGLRERFYSQAFFTLHSFMLFSRLPCDRQFKLKVSRVSCWTSEQSPGPTIFFESQQSTKDLYVVGSI